MSAERPAEGLLAADSDEDANDAPAAAATTGVGLDDVSSLKEVLDSLKAALHSEKASGREKEVQLHKALAERDIVVGEHRRAARAEVEAAQALLEKERAAHRELETQLQDVLSLWESAAGEARSEAAAELSSLRAQVESLNTRVAESEGARLSTLR